MQGNAALESCEQAGAALFALARRFMILDKLMVAEEDDDESTAEVKINDFLEALITWELRMGEFERDAPGQCDSPGAILIVVRLYHTMVRFVVEATGMEPETRWDGLLGYFERMLSPAESVPLSTTTLGATPHSPLSLEPGLIIPVPRLLCCAAVSTPLDTTPRNNFPAVTEAARGDMVQRRRSSSDGAHHGGEGVSHITRATSPATAGLWTTVRLQPRTSWEGLERVAKDKRVRETLVTVAAKERRVNLSLVMCSGDEAETWGSICEEELSY